MRLPTNWCMFLSRVKQNLKALGKKRAAPSSWLEHSKNHTYRIYEASLASSPSGPSPTPPSTYVELKVPQSLRLDGRTEDRASFYVHKDMSYELAWVGGGWSRICAKMGNKEWRRQFLAVFLSWLALCISADCFIMQGHGKKISLATAYTVESCKPEAGENLRRSPFGSLTKAILQSATVYYGVSDKQTAKGHKNNVSGENLLAPCAKVICLKEWKKTQHYILLCLYLRRTRYQLGGMQKWPNL